MSFSTCAELSRCFAAASAKPNSGQSNGTSTTSLSFLTPIGRYGAVSSVSRSNKTNRIVAEATQGLTYRDAGVDIDAGSELVRRIAKMAPGIGGFGGLFPLGDSYLVAGTDGVGTKVMLAFETGIHDTIGIDLVAMSVNDIVTSGAKPLFFLDYFATGHLDVDVAEKVIKGIVDGCKQSDCVLLGGETAEMPGLYKEGEYDLSGCAVGIVKKDSVINGSNIVAGDVIIGLPSSGVHSNGFSLVRRVLAQSGLSLKDQLPGSDVTIAEALMAPTVIYVKQVLDLVSKGGVKGIAHITGGGFTDNIPRVFPEGLGAVIYDGSWEVPAVFKWLQERDIVGIGGSWSDFADYFLTSLKSQDLKLVLEPDSNSDGVSHVKLVAQKSKGMPLITIPLTKLMDSAAMEVKLNFCSSLFEAFEIKSTECSLEKVSEREHSARTNMLAAEKERNEAIQLEQRQKFQKISNSENGVSTDGLQNSPDKQAARDTGATKVKNRKVPAYRRTKIRGALLHDSDE